jgi:hypothetical protein
MAIVKQMLSGVAVEQLRVRENLVAASALKDN